MIVAADADIECAAHAVAWGPRLQHQPSWRRHRAALRLKPGRRRAVHQPGGGDRGGLSRGSPPPTAHRAGPRVGSRPRGDSHCGASGGGSRAAGRRHRPGGGGPLWWGIRWPPTTIVFRRRCSPTSTTGCVLCGRKCLPLLPIMPVSNMDEAIALANDTPYGLSASIWTRNRRQARRWAEQFHTGGVAINDCLVHLASPNPVGGVRDSGFGRVGGREGLGEFCASQSVVERRFGMRRSDPLVSLPRQAPLDRAASRDGCRFPIFKWLARQKNVTAGNDHRLQF